MKSTGRYVYLNPYLAGRLLSDSLQHRSAAIYFILLGAKIKICRLLFLKNNEISSNESVIQ